MDNIYYTLSDDVNMLRINPSIIENYNILCCSKNKWENLIKGKLTILVEGATGIEVQTWELIKK